MIGGGTQMKKPNGLVWYIVVFVILILSACSSGGGGDANVGSGTIQMSITDAKPMLPDGATNLFVTFEEVLVHKSGGSWVSLPLVQTPYTIDLLQFHDGNTTELVPPTKLDAGKYTQVRIVVSSATIRFDDGNSTRDEPVDIPSGNLKTDKSFIFDVTEPSAVDIVVHFDLSKSLVVTGPAPNPSYKLKPVLHFFEDPSEAATIEGSIVNSSFGASEKATITVFAESNHEIFTIVEVSKSDTNDPTEFSIFWLVPNQSYTVEIDLNQDDTSECEEFVEEIDLPEGAVFELNGGDPIENGKGICS
jgi:hypothetical protein